MATSFDLRFTLVCAAHSARGCSSELFQFSTTDLQWEQLDATMVSGSPPSARAGHGMASVGSDIYVFGGAGEEGLCDDGQSCVHAR